MRIAIDCRLIGPTGIGVFIDNVLDNIVKNNNHEYMLIGNPAKLEVYKALRHCSIIPCCYGSFSLKELLFFPTEKVNQCDAFFTPNFNIPIGIKVPIFSTIHDILFFETENFGSALYMIALRWYVKRALRISMSVFTVSDFSKQRIASFFNSNTELIVVPNGINKSLRSFIPEQVKEKKGIVFLGSIKKHKGLHILLAAYQKLRKEFIGCPPLNIIGHVDFRTKDHEMISFIEKNKNGVNFLGAVGNEELYNILASSSVLVSPSFYEGFGIPPLEAMYLGTPTIISDIPVYKEVYKNLPVTFFKTGDTEDLFEKLKSHITQHLNIKEKINKMYNYKDTSNIILSHIQRVVNG